MLQRNTLLRELKKCSKDKKLSAKDRRDCKQMYDSMLKERKREIEFNKRFHKMFKKAKKQHRK